MATYICNVNSAGISDSNSALGDNVPNYPTLLTLTDTGGTFTQTLFTNDDPNTGNQMLAVALTAVAAQCQVSAVLNLGIAMTGS